MEIGQKDHKNYDAWLHWGVSERCNLDCAYCPTKKNAPPLRIDISLLITALEKTKKTFQIGFTGGGEPFLVPNFVDACIEITKKHYISLNTNLTTPQVKEFAEKINPKRVVHLVASAHIQELAKRRLMGRYVNHFFLFKEKGFSVMAREVAYPSLCEEAERYKKIFWKMGIELNFTPFVGRYRGRRYPHSYTDRELNAFDLNLSGGNSPQRHYQYHKVCNAGYNVGVVDTKGDIYPCRLIKSRMGNIYADIKFRDNLICCPFRFCGCPLKQYDSYLFKRALAQSGGGGRIG